MAAYFWYNIALGVILPLLIVCGLISYSLYLRACKKSEASGSSGVMGKFEFSLLMYRIWYGQCTYHELKMLYESGKLSESQYQVALERLLARSLGLTNKRRR
jgi:hypothetical protein